MLYYMDIIHILSVVPPPSKIPSSVAMQVYRGQPGEAWGDAPPRRSLLWGPWSLKSGCAVALGIHNLDQEKAAPCVVVEDHDNEGLVEVNGVKLRCRVSGDRRGGGGLHTLLIQLQPGLVDHLLGWTRGGG